MSLFDDKIKKDDQAKDIEQKVREEVNRHLGGNLSNILPKETKTHSGKQLDKAIIDKDEVLQLIKENSSGQTVIVVNGNNTSNVDNRVRNLTYQIKQNVTIGGTETKPENLIENYAIISWDFPTKESDFAGVKIYIDDTIKDEFRQIGDTKKSSFKVPNLIQGYSYKIYIVSYSKSGIENTIDSSPFVAFTVPYEIPPDITFISNKCYYDGIKVIAEVSLLTNFLGEYEIRDSNPEDWVTDTTGLLKSSKTPVITFLYGSQADSITLYAKAKTEYGKYSLNASTITLDKANSDSAISYGDVFTTYSANLLRNAAFINYYYDDNGKVHFYYWEDKGNINVDVLSEDDIENYGMGASYLQKFTLDNTFYQNVTIPILQEATTFSLSFLATWNELNGATHDTPIIKIEYYDDSGTQIGSDTYTGTAGATGWELNKTQFVFPSGTAEFKFIIRGDASYDKFMLQRGNLYNPFQFHISDTSDDIDDELEHQATQLELIRLSEQFSNLTERIDTLLTKTDMVEILESDAIVLKTQAFRLLVGDINSNYSSIEALSDTLVLKVQSDGYVSSVGLGSNDYGSIITLKADQLNIDGLTTFYNSKTLAQNINAGLTTIDGGMLTADTIIAKLGIAGALLEIDSSDPKINHPLYGLINPGVYVGCTASPYDTDTTRFRIDTYGNIWSGAVNFANAKFSVDKYGYLKATDVKIKHTLEVFDNNASQIQINGDYGYIYITPYNSTPETSTSISLSLQSGKISIFKYDLNNPNTGVNLTTSGEVQIYDQSVNNSIGSLYVDTGALYYKDGLGNTYIIQGGYASDGSGTFPS